MSKIREIFRNLKPSAWLGRRDSHDQAPREIKIVAEDELKRLRESALTLPRKTSLRQVSWQVVDDSQLLCEHFFHLRDALYRFNQRLKSGPVQAPPYYWEAGKLAGERSYFYMKRWEDVGLLFEETARGWMISRADKIASQSQFMRERSPWDQVLLLHSLEAPGVYRVESDLMGEGRVSLTLYEDFLMQTLSKAL